MKRANELTVTQAGAIYIGKLATKELGIYGYKWAAIQESSGCFLVGIYKYMPQYEGKGDHTFLLHGKSGGKQAMTGGCRKFADKLDFGGAGSLDLQFSVVSRDEESVLLRIGRPGLVDEEATPEREKKDAQEKIIREIRANGGRCNIMSGEECWFKGVPCPFGDDDEDCTNESIMRKTEEWLILNGYSLDQETPLGTVSKPAEKQLDIFDLSGKPASSTRTRPLPDGLPEWLSGPFSRGEQVRIFTCKTIERREGWALGAFSYPRLGKCVPLVAILLDSEMDSERSPTSVFIDAVKPYLPRLKSAIECFKIAEKLGIGLSLLQIKAINNGGVPPEGHGLPDEMFE